MSNANDTSTDAVFDAIKVEYKDMASWYDAFWYSYTLETLKRPLNQVIEILMHLEGAPARIVDVGSGTGEFLRRLGDACNDQDLLNRKCIGVEPSKEMIAVAQKKFPSSSMVELKQGPAERLPLENSTTDVVVTTNAFHFFRNKQKALQEMKRILKDNGSLIVTDWCNDYWIVKFYHLLERLRWNWRFRERYPGPLTIAELLQLVDAEGFGNIESDKYRVRVFRIFYWGMQTIRAQKVA